MYWIIRILFLHFFYRIENSLYNKKYLINNINFNPTLVKTHNGLILDNIEEDFTCILNRNEEYTVDNEGKEIYMVYELLFLKNIMDYYERTYKRVQDVISSIDGINQAITIFAIYINSLLFFYKI